jgi:hypothetical protein
MLHVLLEDQVASRVGVAEHVGSLQRARRDQQRQLAAVVVAAVRHPHHAGAGEPERIDATLHKFHHHGQLLPVGIIQIQGQHRVSHLAGDIAAVSGSTVARLQGGVGPLADHVDQDLVELAVPRAEGRRVRHPRERPEDRQVEFVHRAGNALVGAGVGWAEAACRGSFREHRQDRRVGQQQPVFPAFTAAAHRNERGTGLEPEGQLPRHVQLSSVRRPTFNPGIKALGVRGLHHGPWIHDRSMEIDRVVRVRVERRDVDDRHGSDHPMIAIHEGAAAGVAVEGPGDTVLRQRGGGRQRCDHAGTPTRGPATAAAPSTNAPRLSRTNERRVRQRGAGGARWPAGRWYEFESGRGGERRGQGGVSLAEMGHSAHRGKLDWGRESSRFCPRKRSLKLRISHRGRPPRMYRHSSYLSDNRRLAQKGFRSEKP